MINEGVKMKIFLSYAHDENVYLVNRIADDLKKEGVKIWIDNGEIKSGADWRRSITDALLSCDMVIAFASSHAVEKNGVCLDELSIAVCIKGAQIQTVLLESGLNIPAGISYRQYIDMSGWNIHIKNGDFEKWYADKFSELKGVINDPEKRKYAEEVEFIRRRLNPDLSTFKKNNLQRQIFSGRKWLGAKVNEWIKGDDRILVIEGTPGVGKSSFVAHEFLYSGSVGAVMYCEWDNHYTNNIDSISRSLIFQLSTHLPDYRNQVIRILKEEEQRDTEYRSANDTNIFQRLLVKPLQQLIDGKRPATLILIDGIDEVSGDSSLPARNVNVLAEIIEEEKKYFPRWIKFILTTRPDPRVLRPLKRTKHININEYESENNKDIREYLKTRLPGYKDEYINKAEKKCAGNFLYAKLMCDALLNGELNKEDIDKLVPGLESFYLKNFDRTFYGIDDFETVYYPAICAVGYSDTPVPVDTLDKAMKWDRRQSEIFIKRMSPYLDIVYNTIKFYHKSFVDWLRSSDADDYIIDKKIGIERLADGCYVSYQYDKYKMNDYEYKNMLPFLSALDDSDRYGRVCSDLEYAEIMDKKGLESKNEFKYEAAKQYVSQSVLIYGNNDTSDIKISDKLISAYIQLAGINDLEVKLEECVDICNQAIQAIEGFPIDIRRQKDIQNYMGQIYLQKAQTLRRLSCWKDADENYDNAYKKFMESGNAIRAMESVNAKALTYRVRGCIKEALDCYELIYNIPEFGDLKNKDIALYIIIQMSYGWCLSENRDYIKAGRVLKDCADVYLKQPEVLKIKDVAQLYYILSLNAYSNAEYCSALEYAQESLKYVKIAYGDDAVDICSALNQIGNTMLKLGRIQEAIDTFEESVRIRMRYYGKNNVYTAYSFRNLAKAKLMTGKEEDYNEAQKLYTDVYEIRSNIFGKENNQSIIAQTLLEMGEMYELHGEYKEAMEYVERAEKLFLKCDAKKGIGTCYMVKGRILYENERYEESELYFIKARKIQTLFYPENHPYIVKIDDYINKIKTKDY